MGLRMAKGEQTVAMFLRPSVEESAAPNRKIRELLGLNAVAHEFSIVSGAFPENDGEIAILPRSVLQVLVDFGSYIDVPAADLADGSVYRPQRTPEQERLFPSLLNVRHGSSRPDTAYVSVRYRNQWFWIDDRDHQSKGVFGFLMMMFSLTENVGTQSAPVVTVPAR
jgi:hypothetical protein